MMPWAEEGGYKVQVLTREKAESRIGGFLFVVVADGHAYLVDAGSVKAAIDAVVPNPKPGQEVFAARLAESLRPQNWQRGETYVWVMPSHGKWTRVPL